MSENLIRLLSILLAVSANAFYVAAEFALARCRPSKIQTSKEKKGITRQLLLKAFDNLNDYISAAQIGITIASLIVGAFAEPFFAELLEPILSKLSLGGTLSHLLSFVMAIAFATCLHVIIGEFIPKTLAIQNPESVALLTIWPLQMSYQATKPLVFLLNQATNSFLSLFKVDTEQPRVTLAYSEDEIKYLLKQSEKEGMIEKEEREMFDNVFEFSETVAREVMTPRTEIVGTEENTSIKEAASILISRKVSKLPIYREHLDQVTGVVYSTEILKALQAQQAEQTISTISRPILKIPENKSIAALLAEFKRDRSKMALVIDEFGGTSGLVTLEDIIEELVGDIEDEDELPSGNKIEYLGENEWLIEASISIDDVNEDLQSDFSDEHFDTIGGFVFGLLGREAEANDQIDSGEWSFTVVRADRKIETIKIVKKQNDSDNEQKSEDSRPEEVSDVLEH